jgi:acetolactate synthase-1/2/3 large subunit
LTSCGEAVVELLEAMGTDTVFGIPGVHTLELYRGLARSDVRHITPRHEQGAGFMADGWARVTGRPGVCVLISGPGLTNALTPIAQAHHDSIPMLVISGVVPEAERGLGEIHDLPDQHALLAAVTAFSHTVSDPAELPDVFARAQDVFTARRPRPVHVQIPLDVLNGPAAAHMSARSRPPADPPRPAPEAIEAAARLLVEAEAPLILLGGGARDAGGEATGLAEQLGAPVGLTINGRGTVDHDHPLCLGSALCFPPASDVLREADATLLVGAQLSNLELWGLNEPLALRGVIRVDIDEEQLARRYPPAVALHGDAAATLAALAAAVERMLPAADPGRIETAAQRVRAVRSELLWPPSVAAFAPLVEVLDEVLPADRIVAGDSTQPVYAANHSLPVHRPRSWLMPIGYGCLGCALPMAIGAKLAAPNRPVVAIAGDGGFMFTVQELATARDLGLPLPVLVYDNQGYGEIRDLMDEAGIAQIGTDVATHDLPAIARGFGCSGVRAGSLEELRRQLAGAFAASGPTVIELPASALG